MARFVYRLQKVYELRERKKKLREQLVKNIVNSKRQLSDEKFLGSAPAHIIEEMRRKLEEYERQLEKLS